MRTAKKAQISNNNHHDSANRDDANDRTAQRAIVATTLLMRKQQQQTAYGEQITTKKHKIHHYAVCEPWQAPLTERRCERQNAKTHSDRQTSSSEGAIQNDERERRNKRGKTTKHRIGQQECVGEMSKAEQLQGKRGAQKGWAEQPGKKIERRGRGTRHKKRGTQPRGFLIMKGRQ